MKVFQISQTIVHFNEWKPLISSTFHYFWGHWDLKVIKNHQDQKFKIIQFFWIFILQRNFKNWPLWHPKQLGNVFNNLLIKMHCNICFAFILKWLQVRSGQFCLLWLLSMLLSDSLSAFNCFLKIFLICMIVSLIDNSNLLSTFSFSWIPAYNMEIRNMTNQAILLINEFLASTMDLRPWMDVFWQNSFRMLSTMMTAKKKMWMLSNLIKRFVRTQY